ncbi:MAG: response regulator [Magnetococcales bacterium]|nr:response regulator [Magnetococcales bacterium]
MSRNREEHRIQAWHSRWLIREKSLALLLFAAAFWSFDRHELFSYLVSLTQRYPQWHIDGIIPAAIACLLGYVALVARRMRLLNEALQHTTRRLTFFVEHAPAAVAMFGHDGRYLMASRRWQQLFHLQESTYVGHLHTDILESSSNDPRWRTLLESTLDGQQHRCDEEQIVMPGGDEGWIRWESHPWKESVESRDGSILFLEEITERKLSEANLRAKETADEANRAKSRFLATMSHEIRTPLNGVLGMAELLATTQLTDQQWRYMQTLRTSGETLLEIISNILDLSKIEADRLELETIPFNLQHSLQHLSEMFEELAHQQRIRFITHISEDLPTWVTGDSTRLRQILMNLLSNALKFTEEGAVSLRVIPGKSDDAIVFQVEDTGIGMDDAQKARLFQPFTQADSSTTRRYGGTGLGLTISRRIIMQMNGTIQVDTTPGTGTLFTVSLPLPATDSPNIAMEHSEALTSPALSIPDGVRILVVEDDGVNQMVISGILNGLGITTFQMACNGREAVERLEQERFDLIFMDCNMPEMDGYAATQHYRARENVEKGKERLPIIATTANAFRRDHEQCLASGMDDVLTKPINTESVHKMLLRWTGVASTKPDQQSASSSSNTTGPVWFSGGGEDSLILDPPDSSSDQRRTEEGKHTATPLSQYHLSSHDLIDPERLSILQESLQQTPGAFEKIINTFLQSAPKHLQAIRQGIDNKDPETIIRPAHTLKSQSATIGATQLTKTALAVETQAKAASSGGSYEPDLFTTHMETMEEQLSKVSHALLTMLQDRKNTPNSTV